MAKREAKYVTRTDEAVKQALLRLLARKPLSDVSVSELSREAHISRSTFYQHFGNPNDAYDALVADIMGDMSPLMSQITCSDGFRPSGKPFCALVREAGDYAPAVRNGRFLDALAMQGGLYGEHDLFGMLVGAGYTPAQAQAVCSFQMAGCFTAARTTSASASEWEQIRPAIDRFILGGIAACLAAKRSE